jgi:hypothetical protein
MKKTLTILLITALLTLTACSAGEVSIPTESEPDTANTDPQLSAILQARAEQIKVVSRQSPASSLVFDEDGNAVLHIDLPTLLKASLVVIGEFVGESVSGFAYLEREGIGDIAVFPNAFNQIRVIEVLQGDVEIGEIITVRQEYAVDDDGFLLTKDNFTPMNQGDRWIFFLGHFQNAHEWFDAVGHELGIEIAQNESIYSIFTGSNFGEGKYPLPDAQLAKAAQEFISSISDSSTRATVFEEIETSALGVYSRRDFNFALYADILDHFEIETRDWVNPGRDFDARLVELAMS